MAVKRVRLPWDGESERRRREREIEIDQVLATSSAKHVMRLLDVGRVGDDLLLVMPLADRSLSAAVQAGDLGDLARVEAFRQVAQGLVELAEIPVLHRDLKPANVLGFAGSWRLADFGISRNLLESTDTYTFRGHGTLPYMAPELWVGQPATVKTDLYALGVLAFEVLAGGRPFTGVDEPTLRRQHQHDPPPALPAVVPAGVARLVLRLLAKDPAARPQDARAVVEALDAAIKRLSPPQEALRETALVAQQRRAGMDAASAARAAKEAATGELITQALADLQAVLEEAADQAREALPEAYLEKRGLLWELCWDSSKIVVEVWTQSAPRLEVAADDPLLLAGVVAAAPNAMDPYANLVCEVTEDRLAWSVLRFRASALFAGRYEFGPQDRLHGFDWHVFAPQRPYMVHPMGHAWHMEKSPLTAETVVDLLREAISRS